MTQLNYISDETEVKDIRNIVRAIARKTRETPRQTVKDIEILAGCLERIVDIDTDGSEGNRTPSWTCSSTGLPWCTIRTWTTWVTADGNA